MAAAPLAEVDPLVLATAITQVAEALLITDPEGKIQYTNPAFTRLTGYSAEEAAGQTPRFLKSGKEDPEFYRGLWSTILAGSVWQGVLTNKRKDGSLYTEEMSITPVRNPRGVITHFIAIKQDVTERRAAAAASSFLASLVEASSDAIFGLSLDEKILSWNRGAEHLYGYSSEEIIGRPGTTLIAPERHELFHLRYQEVKAGRNLGPYEGAGIRKDGNRVQISATVSPIRDATGVVSGGTVVVRDITARLRTEQIVQSLSNNLREVERVGHLASWELDMVARELRGSEELFRLFTRVPRTEPVPFAQALLAIPKADRRQVNAAVENALRTHEPFDLQHRILCPDGALRVVRSRGQAVQGLDGQSPRIVGTTLDITEAHLAHEKLALNEEKYRSLVLNIPDVTWTAAVSGETVYVSPNVERVYGFTAEEICAPGSDLWLARIHPADSKRVIEAFAALFSQGNPFDVEYQVQHKDGRWIWIHDRAIRTHEHDGVLYADGIFNDITERKRVEDQLRKLSRAVEQSPACVVITDPEGNIEYVNSKFTELTGYAFEEIRGKNPRFLKSGLTSAATYRELWQIIRNGGEWRGEFANKKKSGELYWEHASVSALRNSRGQITNFIAIKQDITERKAVEQELRMATQAAEAASRAKSQFLATMSHEIRTPMNGVIGMTGLLLQTELTPEQHRFAEIVRASGQALMEIINSILDFSKIEAGKLSLEPVDFDLSVSLQYAAELLAVKAQEKGLELTCEVEPGTPRHLRGDEGRLRQVLLNLLGNAVKFTHHGEVALKVSIERQDEHEATLCFTVMDTGIGFRQDQAADLFAPFVQADGSTTRRYGGTGLGLAIAKRLVEMMGGDIGVESIEGQGSTFWFTAPFEKQAQAGLADDGPEIPAAKTLIVDDNSTARSLLAHLLRSWGCETKEVADAESGLAALRQAAATSSPFRVALLDLTLPRINGEELGRQIAADPQLRATAPVLMTGVGKSTDSVRLRKWGFKASVSKPIWESALRQAMAQALNPGRKAESNPSHPAKEPPGETANQAARILVAEDNPTNQEVVLAILNKFGYRAHVVADGAQALMALERADYDIVLMDCLMPGIDGYEATRRIRQRNPQARNHGIPIVALTADVMEGDRDKCLAAGMSDYLAKPIQPQQLADALAKWLASSAAAPGGLPPLARHRPQPAFHEEELLARLMGDKALARTVVAGFLNDFPRQLQALKMQIEQRDSSSAKTLAHALKGAAATVSARSLCATALDLQQAAAAENFTAAEQLLSRLNNEFHRLNRALKQAGWI